MTASKEISHVAMYLRISREKKNENRETLENHRQMLREYAKEKNYTYEEFGEVISGGKSEMENRPQLQRLLNHIERFDALLCVELSRLSRNGLISQTVKQYCIDYDKPIITPYQIYDLANSETDRLMFDVGSMISSHEHGIIGKRSKANKIQMSKAGLHVSGNVPFGYRRNPATKKLEIYEAEAKIVRYIFQLHSNGLGSFKIRDILNHEGYKTSRGNYFNLPTIKRIIRNPAYKGCLIFHDRKRVKRGGKWHSIILDTIVFEGAHEPIITTEEWNLANQEQAGKHETIREKPASTTGATMLKDLIFCGCCGRKMRITKDSKQQDNYFIKKCEYLLESGEKCKNCGIKLTFVEDEVLAEINSYSEKLAIQLKSLESVEIESLFCHEQKQRLDLIGKRLQEISAQKKKLLDLALSGIFSSEEIMEKKQEFSALLKKLSNERNTLMNEMKKTPVEDIQGKIKEILAMVNNLKKLDPEHVNQTFKTFIKRIEYSRVIPEDLLMKSTRNPQRKAYPFKLQFIYY